MGFAEAFIESFLAKKEMERAEQVIQLRKQEHDLQKQLLQHNLRSLGIKQKQEARDEAKLRLQLLSGQPEANYPMAEGEMERPPVATPIPGIVPQEGMARRSPPMVQFPAIEEFGIPQDQVQAQSMEQLMAQEREQKIQELLFTPRLFNPGQQVATPGTGEVLYSAPFRPATNDITGGSFEDYMQKAYGPDPTGEQILEGRRAYQQVDDKQADPVLQALRQMQLAQAQRTGNVPAASQRRINVLADQFKRDPAVARAGKLYEANQFITSLDPNSTNPADDQALIYAFAKAMDPDSAVREGEYQTVQKYAQSWLERFGFNAARVLENTEFLTPQARQNIKQTIGKRTATSVNQYGHLKNQYIKQINRITGADDGEDFLIDSIPTEGSTTGGSGATSPQAPASDTNAPPNVQKLLASKPKGVYTLKDGSKWLKSRDGSITRTQ